MKLLFRLKISVVYDPLGPFWPAEKAGFGDFDIGFHLEGDFLAPIDGGWEATASEGFTGNMDPRPSECTRFKDSGTP